MRISDWSSDVCSSDLKPHALGFGGCPGADCLAFDDVEGIERDAQLETLFSFELRNQRHQRFAQGGRQFVAMRTIAEHDYGPRPSNRSSSCSSTSETIGRAHV